MLLARSCLISVARNSLNNEAVCVTRDNDAGAISRGKKISEAIATITTRRTRDHFDRVRRSSVVRTSVTGNPIVFVMWAAIREHRSSIRIIIGNNAASSEVNERGYDVRRERNSHGLTTGVLPLLVVKDFQSVDLPFAFDRDILDFPTEYSRYHLNAWISDRSLIRLIVVPVNATIQQNSCFNLVTLRTTSHRRTEGPDREYEAHFSSVTSCACQTAPLSPCSRQRKRRAKPKKKEKEREE